MLLRGGGAENSGERGAGQNPSKWILQGREVQGCWALCFYKWPIFGGGGGLRPKKKKKGDFQGVGTPGGGELPDSTRGAKHRGYWEKKVKNPKKKTNGPPLIFGTKNLGGGAGTKIWQSTWACWRVRICFGIVWPAGEERKKQNGEKGGKGGKSEKQKIRGKKRRGLAGPGPISTPVGERWGGTQNIPSSFSLPLPCFTCLWLVVGGEEGGRGKMGFTGFGGMVVGGAQKNKRLFPLEKASSLGFFSAGQKPNQQFYDPA